MRAKPREVQTRQVGTHIVERGTVQPAQFDAADWVHHNINLGRRARFSTGVATTDAYSYGAPPRQLSRLYSFAEDLPFACVFFRSVLRCSYNSPLFEDVDLTCAF
jgi:hypothetical protein